MTIVFDDRGSGLSDKPKSPPYTTRGFAQDAIAILDDLGVDRAHIYGISMGGRVCQWLAIDHPARIGSVVLGCTTPGNAHGVVRPEEVNQKMQDNDDMTLLSYLVSPEWMEDNPEFVKKWEELARDPIPEYAQRLHYLASEGHDSWNELEGIQAPTLVIHGDQDFINMTANAYLLHEQIPNAELYMVNGGRHLYFIEFQEESSRAVLDFLDRHKLNT